MLSILAVIAAASSLGGSLQEPGHWRQVDDTSGYYVALDMASIGGPPTARTARSVGVSADPDGFPGYMILDVVFDCEARTISADRAAFFSPDGDLIETVEGPTETSPVSEEEGTLVAANVACDGAIPDGPGFDSAQAYARSIRALAGS